VTTPEERAEDDFQNMMAECVAISNLVTNPQKGRDQIYEIMRRLEVLGKMEGGWEGGALSGIDLSAVPAYEQYKKLHTRMWVDIKKVI